VELQTKNETFGTEESQGMTLKKIYTIFETFSQNKFQKFKFF